MRLNVNESRDCAQTVFFDIRYFDILVFEILRDDISAFTFTALNEVGIYRVSGVTSDVQHLKKMFDKSKYERRTIFKKR